MSIKLYDDALLKKLQNWTQDTSVLLTGVNESTLLFSTMIDSNNDKPIQLPLIALSRPGGFVIVEKYKQPKRYNGVKVATIETTANVTEYGKSMRVMVNFKRKLLNVYGNAQFIDDVNDEKYYQDFFSKVDKAIFLQKQKI